MRRPKFWRGEGALNPSSNLGAPTAQGVGRRGTLSRSSNLRGPTEILTKNMLSSKEFNLPPENPSKEVSPEEFANLRMENERLRVENEELKHDRLTGLLDYRQFYKELFRISAEKENFSVVMIDLNYLNYFNALGRGHKGGDEALKKLVQVFQETAGNFIPYRCSRGDEFSLIVQGTGKEAQEILTQIKNRLAQREVEGAELPLAISSSLATKEEAIQEIRHLPAEEKTSKSEEQLLAETIADLADKRSLAVKRENHREMLLGFCRQDMEKFNQFSGYLIKGADMTIDDLQKMKAENSEKDI